MSKPEKRISRSFKAKGLDVDFQMFGEWGLAEVAVKTLSTKIEAGSLAGQISAANKYRTLVRRNIRDKTTPGLSKRTQRYRLKKGFSADNVLMMSRTLYDNIVVIRRGKRVFVSVKPKVYNPVTSRGRGRNMTVGQVARVLEFGSANSPARPVWYPAFKQLGGTRRIKKIIQWHIRAAIMKGL